MHEEVREGDFDGVYTSGNYSCYMESAPFNTSTSSKPMVDEKIKSSKWIAINENQKIRKMCFVNTTE